MNEIIIRSKAEQEAKGDIDSIWVYGNQAQSKLTEFSRHITQAVYFSNEDNIEQVLNEVVIRIENLSLAEGAANRRKSANKKTQYLHLLKIIEDITVQLRLRQAKLLKNLNIYERMGELIRDCQKELSIYVEVGLEVISGNPSIAIDLQTGPEAESAHYNDWKSRFGRKLEELQTALVIASQAEIQIELLKHNCFFLAEKIGMSLATTIPLWRNQAALALGLDEYSQAAGLQKKLDNAISKTVKDNNRSIRRKLSLLKKSHEPDMGETVALNDRLEKTLRELIEIEQKSKDANNKMQEIIDTVDSMSVDNGIE